MPRQEKLSRVVRIGPKSGSGACSSAGTVESKEAANLSPALPKSEDQNLVDSQDLSEHSQTKETGNLRETGSSLKRPSCTKMADAEDDGLCVSNEMQKILESFGSDINKTLAAKKQRLEKLTSASLKVANQKVDDSRKTQQVERQKLFEDFQKQTTSVLQQWELDLEKAKENEDKLNNLMRQQLKLFQQTRVVQSQRLRTIKELHEQYTKGLEELEKNHQENQKLVQGELKKEMALLHKKILTDTQQQEMANVRKSLQTMLF